MGLSYDEKHHQDLGQIAHEGYSSQVNFRYFEPQDGTGFVLAETQTRTIGVLTFKVDASLNLSHHIIHVEKPYRRSGVGETLMGMYFQNDPFKLGFGVYIRAGNAKSIAFHEKLGYQKIKEAEKGILYFTRM
ncbi:GNAT family N-acetyltransferase [Candidatus Gracilibacteria bacterium]|nr:GNAT family N-acetyltransferase [Candidatus Gracilibacteria bacterium]